VPAQITIAKKKHDFNPHAFLSTIGRGRDKQFFQKKSTIFAQGDPSDGLFYIQTGKVRLNVVSDGGKEATLGILSIGDFFGEGGLAGQLLHNESGAKIVGHVPQIFAEAEYPISG
jgi:CRP-like cAMP-binding protein